MTFNVFGDVRFAPGNSKDAVSVVKSDTDVYIDLSRNIMVVGKETDNFLIGEKGKLFNFTVEFNVNDVSAVKVFNLSRVKYKDFINIKLNGNSIYSGPRNGEIRLLKHQLVVVEESEHYSVEQGGSASVVEEEKVKDIKLGTNIKNFIQQGTNKLEIAIACGYNGCFYLEFGLQQANSTVYQCSDVRKTCFDNKPRMVDGFEVSKDCWEWKFVKTCNYPSKNNCGPYRSNEDCYLSTRDECLLRDSYGNCVNEKHTY